MSDEVWVPFGHPAQDRLDSGWGASLRRWRVRRRQSDMPARVAAAWAALPPEVAVRLLCDPATQDLAATASWLADEVAGRAPVNWALMIERLEAKPTMDEGAAKRLAERITG